MKIIVIGSGMAGLVSAAYLAHHAFGGIAPVMGKQNPAHRTPVEGLWFIGAQSESGGVAGVMIGARKVTGRILEEEAGPPQ